MSSKAKLQNAIQLLLGQKCIKKIHLLVELSHLTMKKPKLQPLNIKVIVKKKKKERKVEKAHCEEGHVEQN